MLSREKKGKTDKKFHDCLMAQGQPLSISWCILSSLFKIHIDICSTDMFLHDKDHTILKPNVQA